MINKKIYTREFKSGYDIVIERVSIKDIIRLHNDSLSRTSAQICAYNWSSDFCVKELKLAMNNIPNQVKGIDFSIYSKEELYELGFGNWDNRLVVIPLSLYNFIPNGTKLTSISGKVSIKGIDDIDLDVRFGCMAYGFVKETNVQK